MAVISMRWRWVDDPTQAKQDLERVTTPKQDGAGGGCSGFNPLARHDAELFQSILAGEHCLRGFNNRDIRAQLASTDHLRTCGRDSIKESAKVSRTFRRFHAHGLIAMIASPKPRGINYYARPSIISNFNPPEKCWAVVKNHCAEKCDYTLQGLRAH